MSFLKVEGHEKLVRDMTTGAIINNNENERQQYLKRKEALQANKNRIDNIENTVDNLNSRIDNIENKLNIILKLVSEKL